MKYFRIKNIPYCALIDIHGNFAFIGHPKWRKLDKDITALIEGKKIAGRGTLSFRDAKDLAWKTLGNDI